MGEEGFSSDSSLLYHRNIPSTTIGAAVWELPDQSTTPNHPLTPRHLKLHDLFDAGVRRAAGRRHGSPPRPRQRRRAHLVCRCRRSRARGTATASATSASTSSAARRASRRSSVPSRWGRATTSSSRGRRRTAGSRRRPTTSPLRAYCIEANSHIAPPKRYLSKYGQLLEHAPYCERDLRQPEGPLLAEDVGAEPRRADRRLHQAPRQRPGRRRRHDPHAALPPARRRRLGRLPLPLRLQRA